MLSDHVSEYNDFEIIKEILARNDLPMHCTRLAYIKQAELLLLERQWDEVDKILSMILAIEDLGVNWWMKWVVAMGKGNTTEADICLKHAKKKNTEREGSLNMALGWYCLGDMGRAMENLNAVLSTGIDPRWVKLVNKGLWDLMKSEEFSNKYSREIA